MDPAPLLLAVGAVAVLLLALVYSQRRSAAAVAAGKKDDDAGRSQAWRGAGGQTIDPQLRNRHGIQNGEVKYWSLAEVAKHNKPEDCFIVVQNKVYDISDFVEDHPGGVESVLRNPGGDNTEKFSGIQHPAKVWDMIEEYYVGEVKKDEQVEYTFKQVSKL